MRTKLVTVVLVALFSISVFGQESVALDVEVTGLPVEDFLAQLDAAGIPFTSTEARSQAEQFRDTAGLLPDLILENMYPDFWAIQSQITSAIAAGGGRVFVSKGSENFIWPQTLNFRQGSRVDLIFEPGQQNVIRFPSQLATAPVIDMTGTEYSTLDGFRLALDSNFTMPGCGVFLGREYYEDNANLNILRHVDVRGNFGNNSSYGGACLINVGCEVYRITDNCNFRFSGKKGGAYNTSSYNDHRITSPHGIIAGGYTPGAGGAQSNAGGVIDGSCHFACDLLPTGANPDERYIIKLGSRTHSVWIHDIYITAKTYGSLEASFVLGDETDNEVIYGGTSNVTISNLHDEAYASKYFVKIDGVTRKVTVKDIGNIQSGMIVGYGSVYNSRWTDGLRLENLQHRPHPTYWTGEPTPATPPEPEPEPIPAEDIDVAPSGPFTPIEPSPAPSRD